MFFQLFADAEAAKWGALAKQAEKRGDVEKARLYRWREQEWSGRMIVDTVPGMPSQTERLQTV